MRWRGGEVVAKPQGNITCLQIAYQRDRIIEGIMGMWLGKMADEN
jgi:hypothetical protein